MQRLHTEQSPLLRGNGHANGQTRALVPTTAKSSSRLSIFSIRLLLAALGATVAFFASFGFLGKNQLADLHPLDFSARTERLLDKYGIFDGHNDLVCMSCPLLLFSVCNHF